MWGGRDGWGQSVLNLLLFSLGLHHSPDRGRRMTHVGTCTYAFTRSAYRCVYPSCKSLYMPLFACNKVFPAQAMSEDQVGR